MKLILLSIGSVSAILIAGIIGPKIYKKITHQIAGNKFRQIQNIQLGLSNNLLLRGFKKFKNADSINSDLVFTGHIYPRNNKPGKARHSYVGDNSILPYLKEYIRLTEAKKIVFGGDNIDTPDKESLDYLLEMKTSIKNSQYLVGNHERIDTVKENFPQHFSKIFKSLQHYEDINRIRYIYLTSAYGEHDVKISDEMLSFLQKTLVPSQYDFALIFIHHPFWQGSIEDSYDGQSSELTQSWYEKVHPILLKSNVKAVFSGNGGYVSSFTNKEVDGIFHINIGWPRFRDSIPHGWVSMYSKGPLYTFRVHQLAGMQNHYYKDLYSFQKEEAK